jgi:hypothetical protein
MASGIDLPDNWRDGLRLGQRNARWQVVPQTADAVVVGMLNRIDHAIKDERTTSRGRK